jgi:hypothetical protein
MVINYGSARNHLGVNEKNTFRESREPVCCSDVANSLQSPFFGRYCMRNCGDCPRDGTVGLNWPEPAHLLAAATCAAPSDDRVFALVGTEVLDRHRWAPYFPDDVPMSPISPRKGGRRACVT